MNTIENKQSKVQKTDSFDMGKGSVWSVFKKIWIPAIVTAIIAGTFTVFDTFFVSLGYHSGAMGSEMMILQPTEVSSYGVSAMSYAQPYTFLIIGIGVMIGGAIAQKLSKAKAEGDTEKAQRIMNSYFPTLIISSIVVTTVLFIFAKPLIWMGSGFQPYFMENWFNNPEMNAIFGNSGNAMTVVGQQLSQATWYLRIQAIGALPYMIMTSGALILRVTGKPGKATVYAFYALMTNMVLDFLFISILGMNLVGAALATIIAQTVTALCYRNYFYNHGDIRITKLEFGLAKSEYKENAKLGSTSFILQAINTVVLLATTMGIGFVFYGQQEVINLYQSSFQGYYALFCFANMILVGTAFTLQPIVVYNQTTGAIDRVHATKRLAMIISLSVGLTYTAIMLFFPQIVGVFVSVQPEDAWTLVYAQRILQMLFLAYIPLSYATISGNYLQAKGQTKLANIIVYLKPIILFPLVLAFGFAFTYGMPGNAGTWVYSPLPGNTLPPIQNDPANGFASLGIFWAFFVAEIPGFIIAYFGMKKDRLADKAKLAELGGRNL